MLGARSPLLADVLPASYIMNLDDRLPILSIRWQSPAVKFKETAVSHTPLCPRYPLTLVALHCGGNVTHGFTELYIVGLVNFVSLINLATVSAYENA